MRAHASLVPHEESSFIPPKILSHITCNCPKQATPSQSPSHPSPWPPRNYTSPTTHRPADRVHPKQSSLRLGLEGSAFAIRWAVLKLHCRSQPIASLGRRPTREHFPSERHANRHLPEQHRSQMHRAQPTPQCRTLNSRPIYPITMLSYSVLSCPILCYRYMQVL